MKYQSVGPLAVIAAALLWSLDGLLRRSLYSLPASVVVFWEHVLGLVVILAIVLPSLKRFKEYTKKQWISLAIVSFLSGALGTFLYTSALAQVSYIPFSVVVLLQQLQPIFAVSAACILLREPLTKRFIFLAALALAAAYGVTFPNLRVNLDTGTGTVIAGLFALGAAACWGASTALSKYSLKNTSSLHTTALRFAMTPFFAFLFVAAGKHTEALTALNAAQWYALLGIVFSTGLVALALYYFGLKRIMASRSTLLELTWPISSVIVGYLFLGDRLSATQLISTIVLLAVMGIIVRETSQLHKTDT